MENEIWKNINNYHGLYQISNMGRVKSCTMILDINGNICHKEEFFLQTARKKSKYVHYELYNILDNTFKLHSAHRLVAIHFIPNPDNKSQVNHKSGNKSDNRESNLEWSTHKENTEHALNAGLIKVGDNNVLHKISDKDVKDIRLKYVPRKYTFEKLASEYNVSTSLISKIINNQKRLHTI